MCPELLVDSRETAKPRIREQYQSYYEKDNFYKRDNRELIIDFRLFNLESGQYAILLCSYNKW